MSEKALYNALCKFNQRRLIYISLIAFSLSLACSIQIADAYNLASYQITKGTLAGTIIGTPLGLFIHRIRKMIISDDFLAEKYGNNYRIIAIGAPYFFIAFAPILFGLLFVLLFTIKFVLI
ncbi:hypothetical protein [Neisseria sp. Ec49-e6-T10]|uniref:hypothetical protein n=1 Tax=Neisseria sp. Ec49-e6-T10 TaxID=3140744 RepID=UPI003EB6C81D